MTKIQMVETQALRAGDVLAVSGLSITFVGEGTRPNHTSVKVHNPFTRSRAASQWRNNQTHAVRR